MSTSNVRSPITRSPATLRPVNSSSSRFELVHSRTSICKFENGSRTIQVTRGAGKVKVTRTNVSRASNTFFAIGQCPRTSNLSPQFSMFTSRTVRARFLIALNVPLTISVLELRRSNLVLNGAAGLTNTSRTVLRASRRRGSKAKRGKAADAPSYLVKALGNRVNFRPPLALSLPLLAPRTVLRAVGTCPASNPPLEQFENIARLMSRGIYYLHAFLIAS